MPSRNSNITLGFGDKFELDLAAYELRASGQPLRLTPKSMDVLFLLVKRRGQLVTRKQIKQVIWGDDAPIDAERNLNTAVLAIRKVLRESAREPRLLKTVHTKGYRFVGTVRIHRRKPFSSALIGGAEEEQSMDR